MENTLICQEFCVITSEKETVVINRCDCYDGRTGYIMKRTRNAKREIFMDNSELLAFLTRYIDELNNA